MVKKDWCTFFPENIFGIYIGSCCKLHDKNCSTHKFISCLSKKLGKFAVLSIPIGLGGGLGCWTKYSKRMYKRMTNKNHDLKDFEV